MCGRFSLFTVAEVLMDRFKVEIDEPIKPRYNIAPGQFSPVVLNSEPMRLTNALWGLIPHWATEQKIGYKMINARAEGILEKSAYKGPFLNQRCLVLADGFYEWKDTPAGKVPYRFHFPDQRPFAFAGIYSYWENPDSKKVLSFSIITQEPDDNVSSIHNRMPKILTLEEEPVWLSNTDVRTLQHIVGNKSGSSGLLTYKISTRINSTFNEGPDLIEPEKSLFDFQGSAATGN